MTGSITMKDYDDNHHMIDITVAQQQPGNLENLVYLIDKIMG